MTRASVLVVLLVALTASCNKDQPATWAHHMSLPEAQRWGEACGKEDLGYQKAAAHGLVSDNRSWWTMRADGVKLSCHMDWDSGRNRVAQLSVMVVGPAGYAVQPGDFAPGVALLEAAVPDRLRSHIRALVPPAVGYTRIGDLAFESLPAWRDPRTGTVGWSIGISNRAE